MKHRVFIISLFIIYMVAVTAAMILLGIGISFDRYLLVLIPMVLMMGRLKQFIIDWLPFWFILMSYEFLRGFAPILSQRVNYIPLINADIMIFGQLPTITLQQIFFKTGSPVWYDYAATILYFLHFVWPVGFAFILWIYKRQFFQEFIAGISLLSYGAWATFLLFPAAPPWYAQKEGYIFGMTKIMNLTLQSFPEKLQIPTLYVHLNPNPVAAMPSLHAAYPTLILLFALKFFGKKTLWFLPIVMSIWVSIVYLGEHYVIDVMVGISYALIFYWLTGALFKFVPRLNFQRVKKYAYFAKDKTMHFK